MLSLAAREPAAHKRSAVPCRTGRRRCWPSSNWSPGRRWRPIRCPRWRHGPSWSIPGEARPAPGPSGGKLLQEVEDSGRPLDDEVGLGEQLRRSLLGAHRHPQPFVTLARELGYRGEGGQVAEIVADDHHRRGRRTRRRPGGPRRPCRGAPAAAAPRPACRG